MEEKISKIWNGRKIIDKWVIEGIDCSDTYPYAIVPVMIDCESCGEKTLLNKTCFRCGNEIKNKLL